MKLDWEFGERIQCSEAEKKECMALVTELCSMANKAKRSGLLSLVQEADETSHFLLRKGLQLVLEGVNPQMVEKKPSNITSCPANTTAKNFWRAASLWKGFWPSKTALTPQLFKSCCYLYSAKAATKPTNANSAMEKITASNPFLVKSNNPELQHR
jgi:hypothetical protein